MWLKEFAWHPFIESATALSDKRFVDKGDVAPLGRAQCPDSRKLDDLHELFIISLICENATLYLGDICSRIAEVTSVTVSPSTVCRTLAKNGYTRKKL